MDKKYKVLHPVKTDDGIVKTGEITLDEKHGQELVDLGTLEEIKVPSVATAPTDPAERQAAIVEALNAAKPEQKPDVKTLGDAVGWKITAAERDEAWATFTTAQ